MRLEPDIDKNYKKKFPLAKEAIKMKLVGRRTNSPSPSICFAQVLPLAALPFAAVISVHLLTGCYDRRAFSGAT